MVHDAGDFCPGMILSPPLTPHIISGARLLAVYSCRIDVIGSQWLNYSLQTPHLGMLYCYHVKDNGALITPRCDDAIMRFQTGCLVTLDMGNGDVSAVATFRMKLFTFVTCN